MDNPEEKTTDKSPYERFNLISDELKMALFPASQNGTIIALPAKSPYFRFTSLRLRDAGGRGGTGWDSRITDLLGFEIINDAKAREVRLDLYVAPGPEALRQAWISYAYHSGAPFFMGNSRNENGRHWQSIYFQILLGKNDYDLDSDLVGESLNRNWLLFLKKRLPYLEAAALRKK